MVKKICKVSTTLKHGDTRVSGDSFMIISHILR